MLDSLASSLRWLCCEPWTQEQTSEASTWARIATPMAVALVARLGIETTDTAFLGHLGVSELASAALALVWVDFTSACLWQAYGATIKSLVAQAVGADNWKLAGAWLWISMLSCTAALLPVIAAWYFTEQVLLGVGYAPRESAQAGLFNRWYILSLPPMMWYICVQNYLQGRGDALPALAINVSLLAVNAGLNFVLIYGIDSLGFEGLGFIGSPIATSITRWVSFFLVLAYAAWKSGEDLQAIFCGLLTPETWSPSRWHELHVKRLLPLMAGNLLENAQLQLVSFLGARLGPHALAAHQVMLQVFFFLTSGLYGLVSATTVRVGHNLGAAKVEMAKFVAWLDLVVSGVIGLLVSVILLAAGEHLGQVFTDDKQVLKYVGQLSHLVGPAYFLMAVFFVSVAVLQGQSRSLAIMASFLPGAWGVSVPLAFVFVLVLHLGLEALWGALVAGYATVTITAAYFVLQSDWKHLSDAAVRRSTSHDNGSQGKAAAVSGSAPHSEEQHAEFGAQAKRLGKDSALQAGDLSQPLLMDARSEGALVVEDGLRTRDGTGWQAQAAIQPVVVTDLTRSVSIGTDASGSTGHEAAALREVDSKEASGSIQRSGPRGDG